MKKYLLSIIALFSFCLLISFTSCDKEDNNVKDENDLIGTWILIQEKGFYYNKDGTKKEYDVKYDISEKSIVYIFIENGIYNWWDNEKNIKGIGDWSLSNNLLILTNNKLDDEYKIKIIKDKLVLISYSDGYCEYVFQKVK